MCDSNIYDNLPKQQRKDVMFDPITHLFDFVQFAAISFGWSDATYTQKELWRKYQKLITTEQTRWLYCVKCPQYSTWLEALACLYVSSNTVSPALKPTSVPSCILIRPAIWPQQTPAENWGLLCPLWREIGSHLTQCCILIHLAIWSQ